MVQVVENWAWLTGRIASLHQMDKHMELEVEVMATTAISGYPDLLAQYAGNRVRIRVAEPPVLSTGQTVKLKARLAGPGLVWGAAGSVLIQQG